MGNSANPGAISKSIKKSENLYRQILAENNDSLREVINLIDSDYFCPEEPERYKAIVDSLLNHDPYFVMADYQAYIDKQLEVDILFQDKQKWAEKALLNIARMGHFSSDRTILEYAEKVWDLKPVVPGKL